VLTRTTTSGLVGLCLLVASATPVAAQARGGASSGDIAEPEVGVMVDALHYGGFNSYLGFDANYSSKTFTQPATSLGIRLGIVAEGGFHHFTGDTLELVQGGLNVRADRFFSTHFQWYGRAMFGIGHFSEGTDKLFTMAVGLDHPLSDKKVKVRGEVAQVWDFFGGGHQVAWRYSIGIALPLK
jgi:hypothetical protein